MNHANTSLNFPYPLIAPSILSADFARLKEALEQLDAAGADWIHVDVMDGQFVPNLTIGPPVIESLRQYSKLPFDVHLMIEHPERSIEQYRNAGADWITVHVEACPHLHRVLTQIRDCGAKAGVSLNPATPVSVIENVLDQLDLVLIMSVNPGFGGQSFIPQTLNKVRAVKAMIDKAKLQHTIEIEVDGGISSQNSAAVIEAGATVLVAGSAIFNSPNMAQTIQQLKQSS